ncbi:MAG: extracellular solute-binding protein [Spirochaetes bacterium]|nr:extracellular solute-binding protein [Spirochaetota bacterium]
MLSKFIAKVKEYLGIIIIGGAFVTATIIVFTAQRGSEETVHIVTAGETLAKIADTYETTVEKICEENYPDISEKYVLEAGTKIKIPKNRSRKIITIRLAHWQLEPGVRDGINFMAKEYQKLHPNVRVVQNAVPETTYGQWFVTQMVGGTPADLMEIGKVPYSLLVTYYMRYFTPLTEYVTQPNPYNANNEFAGIPLRDTTKDGLKNCYIPEVQEYMGIGLSQFLVRMYYNKTLLKQLAGYDRAPKDWREFLDVCEKISKHKFINRVTRKTLDECDQGIRECRERLQRGGSDAAMAQVNAKMKEIIAKTNALMATIPYYVPVANSGVQMGQVEHNMFNVVTSRGRDLIDFNHDCSVSTTETYIGFKTKKVSLDFPPYRAKFALVSNFCSYCIPGFTGLTRDDGVLLFVQQRGIFISTGTWDAQMLEEQAKDNGFEVAVMEFPIPSKDDPDFGRFMEGPAYEDPATGFMFGCPTPENEPEKRKAAIDFLLFLTGKENNIKLNQMIGWIPCVSGAEGAGILKQFKAHSEGVTPALNFGIGGESIIKWSQMYALYQVGQISFEKMRDEFTPYYIERGYNDYLTATKNWRRSMLTDEKMMSMLRARAFTSTNDRQNSEYWTKYRYVMLRPLTREVDVSFEQNLMKRSQQKDFMPPNAYEYSAEALQRIKNRR